MTTRNFLFATLGVVALYILYKLLKKDRTQRLKPLPGVHEIANADPYAPRQIIIEDPSGIRRVIQEPASIHRSQERLRIVPLNTPAVSTMHNEVAPSDTYADIHPKVGYQYIRGQYDQYDQYYVTDYDEVNNLDSCIAIPQTSVNCVNARLVRNGNNIRDAVAGCNIKNRVSTDCTRNKNKYYYPVPTDRPYVTEYAEQLPEDMRTTYYVQTSLNAPKPKTLLVGPGNGE